VAADIRAAGGLAMGISADLSDEASLRAMVDATVTAYGTSKAAIAALTRNVAVQFAQQGIRANAVAPGTVGTETVMRNIRGNSAVIEALSRKTPLGRMGDPDELAGVICFLLSDDASYVTGETVFVDGGRLVAGPAGADEIPTIRS